MQKCEIYLQHAAQGDQNPNKLTINEYLFRLKLSFSLKDIPTLPTIIIRLYNSFPERCKTIMKKTQTCKIRLYY